MKIIWGLLGTLALTGAAHAVPIVIQVNGPDDKPVANAEVRVALQPSREEFSAFTQAREPLRKAARTDVNGVANFDAPESKTFPGQNADDLQYLGAATIWAPNLGAVNVTLQAGANRVQLVKAAGIARGVVRDAKGAPVAGAKVSALGLTNSPGTLAFAGRDAFAFAPGEAAFTALSDGEGRWQIGNLPLGSRANVQLIDPNLAPHKASAPILSVTAPPLAAVANNALAEINANGVLSAVPAASLNGRVLDDKGAAVAGATVWAAIEQGINDFSPPAITTTDAQGAYEIKGLAPGSYQVLVRAPQTSLLVADPAQIQKFEVSSGQNQTLTAQKLVPGGTLEVQVSDATDGKPLPGARVSVSREDSPRAEWTFPLAAVTAADGQLKLNLAPAKYRVYVVADGYASPRVRVNGNDDELMTVVEGKTERREWKLTRGLSVGGRVVDEAGQALPSVGLHLSAVKAGSDYFSGIFMQSNTAGAWQANNFEEGQYQIEISPGGYDQSPEWQLISPKNFAVPARGPITIVARPIAKTSLSGRVVDTEGAGVVNARIVAKIGDGLPNSVTVIQREAFSDAQGNYTLPPFLANAKTVALGVERAGYIANKLPQAQNNNDRWSSSDAVLQALSAHVGGRIVNAQNEAQKGVQVLAPRFDRVAVSDETGAWRIDDLAPGETEIIAVGDAGASVENVGTGRDDVQLKLRPFGGGAPHDIDRASAILEEAWQTSRGSKFKERDSLPVALARDDPDAALAIARSGEESADEDVVVQIVRALAAGDAERALEWAPQVLAGLKTPTKQLYGGLYLAQGLVEKHPIEAKIWLEKSRALFPEVKLMWQKRDVSSKIAVLSEQLKLPDAQKWFEQSLELADPKNEVNSNFYPWLARRVSRVNADWARQTVAAAVKNAPNPAQGPATTIAYAIRRLALWNPEAARQMLDQYGDFKDGDGDTYSLQSAKVTLLIQRLKRDGDVDAALKSAREQGDSSGYILKQIAEVAPVARRAELLREALKLTRAENYSSRSPLIDMAQQLLPYDRALAKSTLDEIAATFKTYDTDRENWSRSRDVAAWALAYREIDPAQARWQLEREWARQSNQLQLAPFDEKLRNRQMPALILAMAPLDVARAQQMIFALPVDEEGGAPFVAARTLSRWLLASAEERQSRARSFWSKPDADDDFSEDN